MSTFKRALCASLAGLILVPVISSALTADEVKAQIEVLLAQIAQLQAKIAAAGGSTEVAPPAGGNVICSISRFPLKRGDSGGDVEALQLFLKSQGYFSVDITGFFGPITENGLIQFQLKVGIISQAADGGVFGARTFQYVISTYCTRPPPPSNQCLTPPPQPVLTCTGTWEKNNDPKGCHVGWTCVSAVDTTVTPINKPPIISSVVGPTTVDINKSNTWRVSGSDPEGNVVNFSVVWGDEGSSLSQLLNISREGTPYSSAVSYSHAYSSTGKFTIVVFAKDASGADTTATLSVQVNDPDLTNIGIGGSSCKLNSKTYPDGEVTASPACAASSSSSCTSYPFLQCMGGTWVAIPSIGSGYLTGDVNSCVINGTVYGNGQSYTLPPGPNLFDSAYPSGGNGKTCRDFPNENICALLTGSSSVTLTCQNGMWSSDSQYGYVPYGTGSLCVSANGIVFTNGQRAYSGANQFQTEHLYMCREGRWFTTDIYGNVIVLLATPPTVTGVYYPPQDINITP
ncbi:MAG: hypothetical protein G01um10148_39 [Parcubacteria group bacterium Gr01-1014_8]|nr:MAG: hypothetical protein G01um10148_39 [Parcubacteria group bacterium Gr01-1014_8]